MSGSPSGGIAVTLTSAATSLALRASTGDCPHRHTLLRGVSARLKCGGGLMSATDAMGGAGLVGGSVLAAVGTNRAEASIRAR